MFERTRRRLISMGWCAVIAFSAMTVMTPATFADSTFTYQGQLRQNGEPVTSAVNLSFRLHADEIADEQVGDTLDAFGFDLFDDDGRFTIDLDFGDDVFDGTPLWLEIWVNGAPLSPRQPIMPTPYALRALTVGTVGSDSLAGSYANQIDLKNPGNNIAGNFDGSGAGLTDINASNISTGTVGSSLLSGSYTNSVNFTNGGNSFAGSFSGSGVGLTNLSASNLSSGTVPSARLAGTYSNTLSLTNSSNSFFGSFSGTHSGSGVALTSLNANNIATGNLNIARMPTGGNWNLSSNLNIGTGIMFLHNANSRVGVGTTNPQSKLHIFTNTDNDLFYNPAMYARNTSPVDFHTVGIQGETTGAAGRGVLGIADHSSGTVVGVWGETNSSSGRGLYGIATSPSGSTMGVYGQVNSPAGWASFFSGGRNFMQGDLGIGTTTPNQKLQVIGNINANGNYRVHNEVVVSASRDFYANGDATALPRFNIGTSGLGMGSAATNTLGFWVQGIERMRITNAGRVGIGVTAPGFRLDLPNIASVDGRGRANAWTTYSSIRWKENVHAIENALETVMALRGVTFDWTPDSGGGHDIGFIAEEVGAIVPQLVTWEEDDSGFAQSLKYDRIGAITVQAIKEQQSQIEQLESEINIKDAEIKRLEARLDRLESIVGAALGIKEVLQ